VKTLRILLYYYEEQYPTTPKPTNLPAVFFVSQFDSQNAKPLDFSEKSRGS